MRGSSALRASVLGMALLPVVAAANGRAPLTNGVFLKPGDPHTALVRTTFGLLVSQDDGCSFHWVCEKAIGYGGEFDPKYAIATDGTIFATTFTGLRVSRDGGCTWVTATAETPVGDPGRVADIWIDALDIGPSGEVWVATAESARANNIYRSTDNGLTFAPRNMESPTIWWKSIKVARSDAQRVYVAGYQVAGTLADGGQSPPTAHLLRSSNGGDAWTELPLAGSPTMQFGSTPIVFVAAVDPTQPDTLLLTSLGANGMGDRLYRSIDAGATFEEVLATTTPIKDVVFTTGGPVMVASLGGSFQSIDNGKTFAPLVGTPQLGCLAQRSDGQLVGCGANWEPDFKAVAVASPTATSWQKQFRFVELAGPLQCPVGSTSQQLCDPSWPALQQQFGATGPTACGVEPPTVDATPMPKPGGGCCDAGEASPLGAVALVGLVVVLGRRRRTR
ncbi:MAG: hypothetical protein H6Q90_6489 [Deltaproteobacteria bacterium]|nr:hypothetical protein [Deltaproteobacteria bacterium]